MKMETKYDKWLTTAAVILIVILWIISGVIIFYNCINDYRDLLVAQNCTLTEKGYCATECYENQQLIPCQNFTGDEHFCNEGICKISGICPTYYEILNNKTLMDCIKESIRIQNENETK